MIDPVASAALLGFVLGVQHATDPLLLPKITEKPLLGFGLFNVTHAGQTAHKLLLGMIAHKNL